MGTHSFLRFLWIQTQRVLLIIAAIAVVCLAVYLVIRFWPGKRRKAGKDVRFPALHKGFLKHLSRFLLVGCAVAGMSYTLLGFGLLYPLGNFLSNMTFDSCTVIDGQIDIELQRIGSTGGISGYYEYVEDGVLFIRPYERIWPNYAGFHMTRNYNISLHTDVPFRRILIEGLSGVRRSVLIWGGYTKDDFKDIIIGVSTFDDVRRTADTDHVADVVHREWMKYNADVDGAQNLETIEWGKLYWQDNGGYCMYPMCDGGMVLFAFEDDNLVIRSVEEISAEEFIMQSCD